jgi:hypothetical protein
VLLLVSACATIGTTPSAKMNHDFRTGHAFETSFRSTQMRDGPSVTSRRPLTYSSLAEAFRFRRYDALTIDQISSGQRRIGK